MSHVILVPADPQVPVEIWHVSGGLDTVGLLVERGAPQPHVRLSLDFGVLSFTPDHEAPMNERARTVLHRLIGVHMVFHGPVLFTEMEESTTLQIVRIISE